MCELLLSGFVDESASDKTVDQQFAVAAAVGLKYLSIRFVDVGSGIKNIIDLSDDEIDKVRKKLDEYGLEISSIGSPLGKTKLLDVEDGTANTYFEFADYLENQVGRICEIAKRLNCRLIRGFSFYHPKGTAAGDHVQLAGERLKAIAQRCDSDGLTYGLEVEANLIGHNAELLNQLLSACDEDAMVLIFDGANLVTQGYTEAEIFEQFKQMKDGLGWIHIKDHQALKNQTQGDYVDEESLSGYVPAGQGSGAYRQVLTELKSIYPALKARLEKRGLPGVFADMEPHLKQGGQFGGFSGPDGFGIATRAFCELCEQAGVAYQINRFDSMVG